ncbi:MMPL family transporter [Streptomyces tropicalis]|uniref:MMPL family transporter n=1 Tax=Streptomyces tropicalis TaxID=3034234 RepID=A0ABT6A385_9ACTN|nr:MMPL family transporter [Streptomyces tropicalis]MDF3299099.1 MMPL family transporter [Streptomyces tropicalis]
MPAAVVGLLLPFLLAGRASATAGGGSAGAVARTTASGTASGTGSGGTQFLVLALAAAVALVTTVTWFLVRTRRRTREEPPRPGARAGRPGRLHRLGRWCARRPRRVLCTWLLVLLAAAAANHTWGGTYDDDFSLPGTSVQQGADLLDAHGSAQVRGTAAQVVLHTDHGTLKAHRDAVEDAVAHLGRLPHVTAAGDPFATPGAVSADGATAVVPVHFTENPQRFDPSYLDGVDKAVRELRADGVTAEYGGPLGQLARPKAADRASEAIGLATAVLVLLLGFGSVVAAGLPLLTAVLGLVCGLSLLGLLAAAFTFGTAAPTLATMMGLGVGIDYALFLVTRHRRLLRDTGGCAPADPAEAAGRAVATSGRAVVVAAVTVALALAGLYASGVGFIGALGVGAGLTVLVAAVAALTLTPALLGLAGRRIDRWRVRPPVDEPDGTGDTWHRWAATVRRRPWLFLVTGVLILGVLAVPAASLRLGHVDNGADPSSYTDRRAYDLITDGFGAGTNGQFTVVADLGPGQDAAGARRVAASLHDALAATPGVAAVSPPVTTPDGALAVTTVTPRSGPQERATSDLLHRLEDDTLPGTLAASGAHGYVTGTTAAQLTFRDVVADRLPVIVAVVVAAAFLLLLTVFRSPVVALKAAVLNLLSIGAAYGVVVAVFQWGWGGSLLGVGKTVPVESYVPMMMFAIVFGLSMDYEVFLLSRIREAWLRGGDNGRSVAEGLAGTARVITCAALIMTSVFLAFLLSTNVVVKMLALGLGVSVVVDATVVRLILVPSTMYLLGRANWWLPGWLDRVLPHLDPEGPSAAPAPAAGDVRAPAPADGTADDGRVAAGMPGGGQGVHGTPGGGSGAMGTPPEGPGPDGAAAGEPGARGGGWSGAPVRPGGEE